MLHRLLFLFISILTFPSFAISANDGKVGLCPFVRIVPERLSDLVTPRSGHCIFYVNEELTVVGGHTTNFVPTPTAEYYTDGEWHPMTMAYSHDNGFAVVLRSGEAIIGGGHKEPLGIGQTYMMERYTPETHSFEGFGCLDRRRVLSNATQLTDGRVIITGNHYADDAIGCYDGRNQIQHIKDVVQGRSNPYILPTQDDNAIIISGNDLYDKHPDTIWVDQVKGNAFRVPLLEQWHPVYTDQPFNSNACATGNYSYLLSATNESGQLGIIEVRDTCFSLLSTACPIPMQGPFGPVSYKGPVVADSLRQRGYVMGVDSLYNRQYVLCIDYEQKPAMLTLYYTDTLEHATITIPIVTTDGDLILAGGIPNDNYKPLATVWLYHFGTTPQPSAASLPSWLWIIIGMVVLAILAYIVTYKRRKKSKAVIVKPVIEDLAADGKVTELMDRICQLMDEDQLYLNSNLRLQDVAVRINTNSSYVSECINSVRNQSFSQFVNIYRVRHAQNLLLQQPDMKTATAATASGFSTEASFFRNFKAVTGMTPREWLLSQQ